MKLKKQITLTALLFSSCAYSFATNAYSFATNATPSAYTVKSDAKTVVIKLKSNRTTGYRWFLKSYDSSFLTPVSYQYQSAKNGLMGAPGIAVWTFQVTHPVVPTVSSVQWVYARSWESGVGKTKLIRVYFAN